MPARFRMSTPAATSRAAHPAREHRLARRRARSLASASAVQRRIGHVLRREDDEQAVAVRDPPPRSRAPSRSAPGRRRPGCRSGCRGSRRRAAPRPARARASADERGQLAAAGDRARRWPARRGRPRWSRSSAAGPRGRGCLPSTSARSNTSPMSFTRSTPARRNAASSTSSRAGERAGVRGGRAAGRLAAPRLDDDDRLGQRHLARGRQERARVADRLHVDDDRARARVVAEVVDEIAPADVEHRAERDERAEADLLAQAPVEDRGQQRAALAQEGDAARAGPCRRRRSR